MARELSNDELTVTNYNFLTIDIFFSFGEYLYQTKYSEVLFETLYCFNDVQSTHTIIGHPCTVS